MIVWGEKTDMGVAESDGSYMAEMCKYSLNTTSRIKDQLSTTDIVFHIGDISYAFGYSSMVSIQICDQNNGYKL